MLSDRPQEQLVLFKEIMLKKMTVRDAEKIARKVAYDKVRKKDRMFDPLIVEMEQEVSEHLGTRVHIEPKEVGGRIQIDYFNEVDLRNILKILNKQEEIKRQEAEVDDSRPEIDEEKMVQETTDTERQQEILQTATAVTFEQQKVAGSEPLDTTQGKQDTVGSSQEVEEGEKKEEVEQEEVEVVVPASEYKYAPKPQLVEKLQEEAVPDGQDKEDVESSQESEKKN
jgi:hypothetical protein